MLLLGATLATACSRDANPISPPTTPAPVVLAETPVNTENNAPGTSDWVTAAARWAPESRLSMYASPYSAVAPETVSVFIHAAQQSKVSVKLYRLGWYGGAGARVVWQADTVAAGPQAACASNGSGTSVSCRWTRTVAIPLGQDWASGVYLVRATDLADGMVAYYPMVVRTRRPHDFLVVIPQFTWQAYNTYGGTGLYTPDPNGGANALGHFVSFSRPYNSNGGWATIFTDNSSHEVRVLRWLEREGYDVGYASDVDLHAGIGDTRVPEPRRGMIFAGHDEYWTWEQYDQVEQFRDRGGHLAFLSGNNAYWNVRLSADPQTGQALAGITCYKLSPDPGAPDAHHTTTLFRNAPLNRPENALYGLGYRQTAKSERRPAIVENVAGGEGRALLDAAGFSAGDTIPVFTYTEGDQLLDNGATPPNLQLLFRAPITAKNAGNTAPPVYNGGFFIAPSGAHVFASGTNEFGYVLDDFSKTPANPRIQRLLRAVLDGMPPH